MSHVKTVRAGALVVVGVVVVIATGGLTSFAQERSKITGGLTSPAQEILTKYPRDTEGTPTPAAEVLKKATLPPGFKMTCFAHEPQVLQPIAINTDDRGRLWVAECFSYPKWDATGHDRLTILEDTNGDGVHDTRKVFWDQGNYLSGFQLGYGGVYVCAAPDILFIPDKNGDDIPDGPPVKVLTGWGTTGKHNVVNSLQWGPDGWLYGCNGITSPSRVGLPETPEKDRTPMECGIWRFHPTRKIFEVVSHGTTNPWGLDWNEEGEAFFTNCVIDHLWHVIPGARYQRMFGQDLNPYAYELMPPCSDHLHWQGGDWTKARGKSDDDDLGGGHAHCGAIFMLGEQWPAEYRNNILTCNIHGHRLNRDYPERTATGYVGKHRPDLIKFNDEWFRGTAFCTGPDGAIYVADWCDTGECHDYELVHRNSGRIYKFWHKELKAWKPGDLAKAAKDPFAVDPTKAPWTARRVLQMAYEGRLHEAKQVVLNAAFAEHLAKEWYKSCLNEGLSTTSHKIKESGSNIEFFLLNLFNAEFYDSATFHKNPNSANLLQLIRSAANHEKARASFINAIVKSNDTFTPLVLLTALAELAKNPVIDNQAIAKISRLELTQIFNRENTVENHSRQALLLAWYALEPNVAKDPAWAVKLLPDVKEPLLRRFIARRLVDQTDDKKLTAALQLLSSNESLWQDAARQRDLLQGLQQGLAGRRTVKLPSGWDTVVASVNKLGDPVTRQLADELSLQFGDPAIAARLLDELKNDRASVENKQRGIALLARLKHQELAELLPNLLDDDALRGAAIRALGTFDSPETAERLLSRYAKLNDDDKLAALETLAGRAAWAKELVAAMEAGSVPPKSVPAYVIKQLNALKRPELNTRLEKVWGAVRGTSAEKQARKTQLKLDLAADKLAAANRAAGKALFQKNCRQCHTLLGSGGNVGPNLTGGQRGSLDYILDNVLDPSALVAKDYQMTVLSLNDGRVLTGTVVEQTPQLVKLRNVQGDTTVPLTDIDEQQQLPISMMPEGLLDKLTAEEIRDLVGYLQKAEKE